MKRKIISMLLIMALSILVFSATVQAQERPVSDDISPKYTVTCSGGGKHYMQSMGWANVYYNGSLLWRAAPFYQCTKCYVAIATQYEVNYRDPIGRYVIDHPQVWLGTSMQYFYAANVYYESSNILDGYEFH